MSASGRAFGETKFDQRLSISYIVPSKNDLAIKDSTPPFHTKDYHGCLLICRQHRFTFNPLCYCIRFVKTNFVLAAELPDPHGVVWWDILET